MNTIVPYLTLLAMCGWGVEVGFAEPQQSTGLFSGDRQATGIQNAQLRPGSRTPDPQTLVKQAISALESHRSINADIRQKINLFGQELFGKGYYMEKRAAGKLLFRMYLRTQAGADQEPSSQLKVFDGRYLWTYRNLRGSESLGRIDVEDVSQDLEESGRIAELVKMGGWPGLGGLPRLLRGLNLAFDFGSTDAEPVRLRDQVPGWRIVGLWKPEKLVKMAPQLKESVEPGKPIDAHDLPDHLPSSVVLLLRQRDLFPYGIEFRRDHRGSRNAAKPGYQGVTWELLQVRLDGPTKPAWFIYNPGDLKYADQTREFLKSLEED